VFPTVHCADGALNLTVRCGRQYESYDGVGGVRPYGYSLADVAGLVKALGHDHRTSHHREHMVTEGL